MSPSQETGGHAGLANQVSCREANRRCYDPHTILLAADELVHLSNEPHRTIDRAFAVGSHCADEKCLKHMGQREGARKSHQELIPIGPPVSSAGEWPGHCVR